ncbi:MAG: type II toxin-antitoxin system VapC family toxin [Burkholderiaceae bacterium]|jgi:PIN domain nuclease of toxin-antitoxin system|nr:type II toxin-antitoxin system VapC family toxin [Burkholderiaceae bacterium]
MKLLLDTHMLLWAAAGTLPKKAEKLIADGANTLYFSSASLWEISIKNSLGREDFRVNPRLLWRALLDNQYQELPISSLHVLALGELPTGHKDPFDRILAAQAKSEGISLLTSDTQMRDYGDAVMFVPK